MSGPGVARGPVARIVADAVGAMLLSVADGPIRRPTPGAHLILLERARPILERGGCVVLEAPWDDPRLVLEAQALAGRTWSGFAVTPWEEALDAPEDGVGAREPVHELQRT